MRPLVTFKPISRPICHITISKNEIIKLIVVKILIIMTFSLDLGT